MHWDMRALDKGQRYRIIGSCIVPRPIAWVSSLSAAGVPNLAPFSFFNAMGNDPPVIALGMVSSPEGRFKDTPANIRDTGEFVVSLVGEAQAAAMNRTSLDAPPHVDEAGLAGVGMRPSVVVAPPRVADAPAAFECRSMHFIETGPFQAVVLAEILVAHVADAFVEDADRIRLDIPAMQLVARMHGAGWYARQTDLFEMPRPKA